METKVLTLEKIAKEIIRLNQYLYEFAVDNLIAAYKRDKKVVISYLTHMGQKNNLVATCDCNVDYFMKNFCDLKDKQLDSLAFNEQTQTIEVVYK